MYFGLLDLDFAHLIGSYLMGLFMDFQNFWWEDYILVTSPDKNEAHISKVSIETESRMLRYPF